MKNPLSLYKKLISKIFQKFKNSKFQMKSNLKEETGLSKLF